MEVDSKPEEIDELDRKIVQMKIEQAALQKRKFGFKRQVVETEQRIGGSLGEKAKDLTWRWMAEKEKLTSPENKGKNRTSPGRTRTGPTPQGEYTRAGELTYGVFPS